MDKIDYYKDYNHERYRHYIYKDSGKKFLRKKGGKNPSKEEFTVKQMDRYEVSFEEIKKIDLNEVGASIPYFEDRYSSNSHRYLMKFWASIIGLDAVYVYLHIITDVGELEKDYCLRNIEHKAKEIGRARNSHKRYLKELEENSFILRFYREDKMDNNKDDSPFVKVRKSVPILSDNQVKQLSPQLQEEHSEFISNLDESEMNEGFMTKQDIIDILNNAPKINRNKESKLKEAPIPSSSDKHKYNLDDTSIGYVYFIRADNGLTKIGIAKDFQKRLDHFTVKLPYELEVVLLLRAKRYYQLEAHIHHHFANKRLKGEWFDISDDDLDYVSEEIYEQWVD